MKPTDTVTTLSSHNLWANLRLLERCAGLTDKQLDATISGTFGTIRDSLEHIVTAGQGYFSRIRIGQRLNRPEDVPRLTMTEMVESASKTGMGLDVF